MKRILILAAVCYSVVSFKADNPRVYVADLKRLTGQKWIGELTYLDYSSNKKTSIKANLSVVRSTTDNSIWYFKNEYPLEPKANSVDTIILKSDGTMFGDERVIDRVRVNKTAIRIVTQKESNDGGKEKLFQYTYTISDKKFSIRKEERNKNETVFIERNVYQFQR